MIGIWSIPCTLVWIHQGLSTNYSGLYIKDNTRRSYGRSMPGDEETFVTTLVVAV